MNESQLQVLLEHYHTGTATPEEAALLHEWYGSLQQAERSFFSKEENQRAVLAELLHKVQGQLPVPAVNNGQEITVVKMNAGVKWIAAAAVLLLVIAGWLYLPAKQAASPAALATLTSKDTTTPVTVQWHTQRNTTAATLTTALPDGSSVTLAAGASLKYRAPFAGDLKREVYTEGQVSFDVKKNREKPFVVYSGRLATTVLGTTFSVYEDKKTARIILFTGKVVVRQVTALKGWDQPAVFLLPGEQLLYTTGTEKLVVTKIPVNKEEETRGLVFENTALPVVLEKLIKQYRVPIAYQAEELSGMYFSGKIQPADSLAVLLQAIAQMNGLTVTPAENGFVVAVSR
jgi:ferric-dicitrate binding protein FerR (iron transport regulator)